MTDPLPASDAAPQPALAGARLPPRALVRADGLTCAVVLSLSAGYLDAFTFVGHGHSFASAMTGNMVLLGIAVADRAPDALGPLVTLLAYAAGAAIAGLVSRPGVRRLLPLPAYFAALLVEVAVLGTVAALPNGFDDHLLVAVVALTTAVQNTTFRTLGARSYNSVIMTGNLQTLAKALVGDAWSGGREARRAAFDLAAVIAAFVGGAAAGAAATPRFGNLAAAAPAVLLAALAAVLARAATRGDAR